VWGPVFGDLDLLSIHNIPKPSAYTYRFLAKTIFSNQNADTVVRITEPNPNLFHYQIQPLLMDVAWSTNPTDSIIVSGTGTLYRWDIPATCDSVYLTYCDSVVQQSSVNVSSSYTIHLNEGVPVFYSWNNVLTGINQMVNSEFHCSVYPNPSNNSVTIDIYDLQTVTHDLNIFNMLGQIVFLKTLNSNHESLNLNLPNGLYYYQVNNNSQYIDNGKIIIQRQ
jgi:hypothetical protein